MKKQQPVSFILPYVEARNTPQMGRGVFTQKEIAAGTLVELAPVIVMSGDERKLLDQTLLHDYIFEWGEDAKQCCMALGLVPVYNHSFSANCEYEMFFSKQVMAVKAVREIKAGEELFINYNGEWNNKKTLWFKAEGH